MQDIIYINSYANKDHHEQFNTILLLALSSFFRVKIYSGKEAKNNMYKILEKNGFELNFNNIKSTNLFILKGTSKWTVFFRYILGTLYNIYILLSSNKKDILIYNFNNSLSLYFLNKLNFLLKRKILIFCHGEMELLINDEGGFLAKLLKWNLRCFFLKKRNINISFCVLGDCVIENLKYIIGENVKCFYSADHPYFFNKNINNNINNNIISFATIGELNVFKGLYLYIDLLEKVNIKDKSFSIIGNTTDHIEELEKKNIIIKGKNHYLDRKEFERLISKIDYALYFYSSDKYKLTASGAIFDAINARKPIIALENNYFRYLFQKYGAIGYLCKNIDEMAVVINNIGKEKKTNFNFDNYINQLSVDVFTKKIFKIIEKI